jgi:hypothetical protein
MKKSHVLKIWLLAGGLLAILSAPVAAASLFETYASASRESLETETREMGRQLSTTFNQGTIADHQQRIDFAEYLSGLKKSILYGTRLATYAEYERDLQFARDNEVFKGLPEQIEGEEAGEILKSRKAYVGSKYERMKKNVEEEIETYLDMMQLSLDACETLAQNDLSGFSDRDENRQRVARFGESKEFRRYLEKSEDLARRWPELSGRIAAQLALWQPRAPSPGDPLIDRRITGAL